MEYEIIWSLQIQEEIKDINDHLLEEWGFQIANKNIITALNLVDSRIIK